MFVKLIFQSVLTAALFLPVFSAGGSELEKIDFTAVEESPVTVDDTEAYDNLRRLVTVMKLLQKLYVDQQKVSMHKLVDGALKGMLHELDPYSSYEPSVPDQSTKHSSRHLGIGIMALKSKQAGFKVICTLKDSPAAKAGVKTGDIIIKIDDNPTAVLTLEQCGQLLRGKPGTKVKLEIIRENEDDPVVLEITRSEFKQDSPEFKDVKMLKNKIGYIRISSFGEQSVEFMDNALKKLEKDNCRALVLDLRNNPGGLVEAAIAICSRFLDEKELIITIEGRDLKKAQKIFPVKCAKYTNIPLVILINRFSASAAEIVAGCMKDHKRAVLLGSRTFGKGSVQRVCKIKDNGTLRFTVANYYTPAHNIINGQGIEPDIKVPMSLKDRLELAQQLEEHPGIIYPINKKMITDIQLERAIQVITGILKLREQKK
ncbi:MAG: S41 family peptidase [Victivallaceae bacterium]|nr:S41 family peptidase [Victivallaceae bacterium]